MLLGTESGPGVQALDTDLHGIFPLFLNTLAWRLEIA